MIWTVIGLPILLGSLAGMREGGSAADVPVADIFKVPVETELAMAARHVARARIIVAQQCDRIARLKAHGCSTREHEVTLGVFINTLHSLEHHERALHASAAQHSDFHIRASG